MQELLDLRRSLEEGRYDDAFSIISEMDEMAKQDKTNKIGSFIRVLLIHIIKQHAEKRTTRSWNISIKFALEEIEAANVRDSSGGVYMKEAGLREAIEKKFPLALEKAAQEAFEGKYESKEFLKLVDSEVIKAEALSYILNGLPESEE